MTESTVEPAPAPACILIVDDDPAALDLLTTLLQLAGYRTRPFERPEPALASALESPPDLALLDVRMPVMDGIELCRRLKADSRTAAAPVIFVSGVGDQEIVLDGFDAGGVDFVHIPIQERVLMARVATHLHLGRIQRDLEAERALLEQRIRDRTRQLVDYQHRLRELAGELARTEARERRNIAAELHDRVGQSLSAMRALLAVARRETRESEVDSLLAEVSEHVRDVIRSTRDIMSNLSSPTLNELGLSAAISEWLHGHVRGRHGLEVQFGDDGEPKSLTPHEGEIVFRSVRELVTNVVKHARASRVSVSLRRLEGCLEVVVEDDGVGMGAAARRDDAETTSRFGLFSIEERMSDIGGALSISNGSAGGVRAELRVPLGC